MRDRLKRKEGRKDGAESYHSALFVGLGISNVLHWGIFACKMRLMPSKDIAA